MLSKLYSWLLDTTHAFPLKIVYLDLGKNLPAIG